MNYELLQTTYEMILEYFQTTVNYLTLFLGGCVLKRFQEIVKHSNHAWCQNKHVRNDVRNSILLPLIQIILILLPVGWSQFTFSSNSIVDLELKTNSQLNSELTPTLEHNVIVTFLHTFYSSPRCSVLANITGTDIYKDRKDYLSVSKL